MTIDGDQPDVGTKLAMRIWYRSASGSRYLTESNLEVVDKGFCRSRGHRRTDVTA
jgi:hypothetical protein